MRKMKNSEILREARQHIEYRRIRYVCHAISHVYGATFEQRHKLRVWVLKLLFPCVAYEAWLRSKNIILYEKGRSSQWREGRLQWMDWMIAYWEKKEKRNAHK